MEIKRLQNLKKATLKEMADEICKIMDEAKEDILTVSTKTNSIASATKRLHKAMKDVELVAHIVRDEAHRKRATYSMDVNLKGKRYLDKAIELAKNKEKNYKKHMEKLKTQRLLKAREQMKKEE